MRFKAFFFLCPGLVRRRKRLFSHGAKRRRLQFRIAIPNQYAKLWQIKDVAVTGMAGDAAPAESLQEFRRRSPFSAS
jgi:hypothetical protein